jgi:alanyl-tRNA synthetase
LRAGGKHNDLDNVGHTARHHTLFEMLGNFSFADYGAETAIAAAWKFVTNEQVGLGIPQNKLRVSVLQGDVATAALWRKLTNSAVEVVECSAKDNFWSMGDGPGPCGPCTEIFFDQGKEVDGDRWLELWNLVLMQNQRDTAGKLHVLPKTSIDTGMGLERVAAVLQGQPTNFDADVFQPLIDATFDILKVSGTGAFQLLYASVCIRR